MNPSELQTRTKVLNDKLDEVFRRWYPNSVCNHKPGQSERKAA